MTDTFVPGGGPGDPGPTDPEAGQPAQTFSPSRLAPARAANEAVTKRVPPQSLEAETAVLAAMMLDNVAANTVVLEGREIPPRSVVAGVPGSVKKTLEGSAAKWIEGGGAHYVELSRAYLRHGIGDGDPDGRE